MIDECQGPPGMAQVADWGVEVAVVGSSLIGIGIAKPQRDSTGSERERVQEASLEGSNMPTIEWMEDEVQKAVPDAIEVTVVDLTGGRDHFHVRVVSPTFEDATFT